MKDSDGELSPIPPRPVAANPPNDPTAEQIKYVVELRKTDQFHKTTRLAIVCGTILSCAGLLSWVVLKSASSPWLQALSIMIGSGGPAYLVWKMRASLKLEIENLGGRSAKIQAAVDAGRTSSDINADGSNPNVD